MNNKIKYNCFFGGGGIRGMCYIGAIKALKEFNIEINSLAGSSVGAVFASLYACGYDENEIKEIFYDFNLTMFRDLNISLFSTDISISKGEIFLEWLRDKIESKIYKDKYKKNNNSPVTFKDIDRNLYILTVDLNTNTPFIFSKETTPNEEIAIAVRASASLPGLMKPVNYKNALLVDGDLIKSWPAWQIIEDFNNNDTRILEFRLEGSKKNTEIKNPADYINTIINTIWYLSTENVFNLYHQNDKYDFIVIDTKDIILFDFNIDKNIKDELTDKGYNDTKIYLTKVLPLKKEKILSEYNKLIKAFELIKKLIQKHDIEKTYNILNEILSNIGKSKYTDRILYEEIQKLKQELTKSNQRKTIFSILQKEDKELINKIDIIKDNLKNRTEELENYIMNFSNKI